MTSGARDYVPLEREAWGEPACDMRLGQSLVVWAIREGRQCARAVDEHLMGETVLSR